MMKYYIHIKIDDDYVLQVDIVRCILFHENVISSGYLATTARAADLQHDMTNIDLDQVK